MCPACECLCSPPEMFSQSFWPSSRCCQRGFVLRTTLHVPVSLKQSQVAKLPGICILRGHVPRNTSKVFARIFSSGHSSPPATPGTQVVQEPIPLAEALAPRFGAKHTLLTATLRPGGRGLVSCDMRCSLPALQGCQMWIWRARLCCCHPPQPSPGWQAQGFEENHVVVTKGVLALSSIREEQLYLVFLSVSFILCL